MTPAAWIASARLGLGGPFQGEGSPRDQLLDGMEQGPLAPEGDRIQDLLPHLAPLGEASEEDRQQRRREAMAAHRRAARRRLALCLSAERPFLERWVMALSNILTVSVQRPRILGFAGTHELQCIRPLALSTYADLLVASTRHPAMLLYLDAQQSVGADSRAGQRRGRGVNENLARELLELHTLGLDGGYLQRDVEELAAALTGWGVDRSGAGGGFRFVQSRHQPGGRTLLGKTWPEGGPEQAEEMLRWLSLQPQTAAHVSRRLAEHFLPSPVPEALLRALVKAWMDSGGSLLSVARALLSSPLTWEPTRPQWRTPWDWVLAVGRTLQGRVPPLRLLQGLEELGQLPWSAPSPEGWSLSEASWTAPASLLRRLHLAELWGREARARAGPDPAELAAQILPESEAAELVSTLSGCPAEMQLGLLLASPPFQRR